MCPTSSDISLQVTGNLAGSYCIALDYGPGVYFFQQFFILATKQDW